MGHCIRLIVAGMLLVLHGSLAAQQTDDRPRNPMGSINEYTDSGVDSVKVRARFNQFLEAGRAGRNDETNRIPKSFSPAELALFSEMWEEYRAPRREVPASLRKTEPETKKPVRPAPVQAANAESPADLKYSRVTQVYERETKVLYDLTYENGAKLEVTGDHRFKIIGRGWIPVSIIQVGDRSWSSDRERGLRVRSVVRRELDKPVKVYNLEVEGTHNYFVNVGGVNVLVHNGEYSHEKSNQIREVPLERGLAGRTVPKFTSKVQVVRNPDGSYGADVKEFKVSTKVEINSQTKWNDIKDFAKYYDPSGKYSFADYRYEFNTRDGTIFHERLHQAQMDREIKAAQPFIERNIARISERSPAAARRAAEDMVLNFQLQIKANMTNDYNHQQIMVQEWQYYHKKYEEYLRSRR